MSFYPLNLPCVWPGGHFTVGGGTGYFRRKEVQYSWGMRPRAYYYLYVCEYCNQYVAEHRVQVDDMIHSKLNERRRDSGRLRETR